VRQGFPVYGVDRTNTGRSATDICKINAVKLGKAPPAELPAINRYAAESSWWPANCIRISMTAQLGAYRFQMAVRGPGDVSEGKGGRLY
jgi:hypothetical protein